MYKPFIITSIFFIMSFSSTTFAINRMNFTFSVGNIYVYKVHRISSSGTEDWIIKTRVLKDTVVYNRKYFYLENSILSSNVWVRFDTLTGNFMSYDVSNSCFPQYVDEKLIDSLDSDTGDTLMDCAINQKVTCTSRKKIFLFNDSLMSIDFRRQYSTPFSSSENRKAYVNIFGLYKYVGTSYGIMGFSAIDYTLKGCVYQNQVYGDTSMNITNVEFISTEAPSDYKLFQNYPNPFNPETDFKFQLSKSGLINLSIYNINGRLIETLINQNLPEGEYKINWNAKNLPSGTYFYRLTINDSESSSRHVFSQTKKMLLIK